MQMLSWLSGTVHATAFAALFRPVRFTADETLHPGIKEGAHANLTSHFVELDDLCGDGWLAGRRLHRRRQLCRGLLPLGAHGEVRPLPLPALDRPGRPRGRAPLLRPPRRSSTKA
jgi:hypothetical protein